MNALWLVLRALALPLGPTPQWALLALCPELAYPRPGVALAAEGLPDLSLIGLDHLESVDYELGCLAIIASLHAAGPLAAAIAIPRLASLRAAIEVAFFGARGAFVLEAAACFSTLRWISNKYNGWESEKQWQKSLMTANAEHAESGRDALVGLAGAVLQDRGLPGGCPAATRWHPSRSATHETSAASQSLPGFRILWPKNEKISFCDNPGAAMILILAMIWLQLYGDKNRSHTASWKLGLELGRIKWLSTMSQAQH